MIKLYKHQQIIIEEDKEKVGIFLGCGGGKSLTALCISRGNVLIIAPKTIVEAKVWEDNFSLMENRYNVNITVISKETFRRDWKKLPRFETIILDEAHTMLGVLPATHYINREEHIKTSQLFTAVHEYTQLHKPSRIYPCTATIAKSAMTVWGCATILGKTWSFDDFREVYYWRRKIMRTVKIRGKVSRRSVEIWSPKTDKATKERLATTVNKLGYVGRISDWKDLPPQIYKNVFIDLTEEQKKRIKEMKFEYPEPIVRVTKINQIENGVLKADEFNPAESFDNGKTEWLKDHAVEFPQMIVFVKYTAQIEHLYKELSLDGYEVFTMTGATQDRGSLLRELENKDEYILIVQSQISAGWELPNCAVMIFASMSYSVVDRIQSEGRISRINNLKSNLYITLIAKGGVDEAILKCITNKQDFNEAVYNDKYEK